MSEHQPFIPNLDSAVNQSADLSPDPRQSWQPPHGPSENRHSENRHSENGHSKPDRATDWQVVEFPNAISLSDIPGALPKSELSAPPGASPNSYPDQAAGQSMGREDELLNLVRDLNQCNDGLLTRVTQLETALETAQTALQSEIERAQQSHDTAGVQQSSVTWTAQQQIAQLVSELDTAEQALKRQQRLNETLRTELSVSHDRIAQLERECALVQQQHSERSQALTHTEAACRDLRSRLQRQQRYTLQFKVALEKSLNASSQPSSAGFKTHSSVEPATSPAAPVTLPKAQRIQPWASDPALFEPVDPHLESLIRGLNPRSQTDLTEDLPASPEPQTLDPEAEAQLWQDLERVIDGSAVAEPMLEPPAKVPEEVLDDGPVTAKSLAEAVEASFEAATSSAAAPTVSGPSPQSPFTEPSPWGQPLSSLLEPPQPAQPAQPDGANSLPVMTPQGAVSSPAPVVYPLRPQKRVRSLAAIELPNFPKKAGPKKAGLD